MSNIFMALTCCHNLLFVRLIRTHFEITFIQNASYNVLYIFYFVFNIPKNSKIYHINNIHIIIPINSLSY